MRVGVGLALAILLTILSLFVQRHGPEQVVYGNLCGPSGGDLCYRPALNGGFPFAYVFDKGGISVEEALGPEDDFRPVAFALDVALYGALSLAAAALLRRRARRRERP